MPSGTWCGRSFESLIAMTFGCASVAYWIFQQDLILKQFFDIRVGVGEIVWSPNEHNAIAGLLDRIRVSSSEAEIGLVVRSDLKRNDIGESLVRGALDRSTGCHLETLSCVVLRENKPTLALARKIGFFARSITAQSIEFEFKL